MYRDKNQRNQQTCMSPTTTSIRERSTLAKHAAITNKKKHGLSPAWPTRPGNRKRLPE
jgi:hypothetical protein